MVLGIDVGNSNIVFCVFEHDNIISIGRTTTETEKSSEHYSDCISKLLHESGIEIANIEDAVISSVVPAVNEALKEAVSRLFDSNALIIGSDTSTGLEIYGKYPEQLGVDVIVGCVAAMQSYPLPLAVIDMGTATTFAVVDRNKTYTGGIIFPGPRLLTESLNDKTSQLESTTLEAPKRVLGQQTSDRINSGIIYGNASMIDGMITKIEKELGEAPTIVATGGLMPLILPHCERKMIYDELLIPRGLTVIYYMNR